MPYTVAKTKTKELKTKKNCFVFRFSFFTKRVFILGREKLYISIEIFDLLNIGLWFLQSEFYPNPIVSHLIGIRWDKSFCVFPKIYVFNFFGIHLIIFPIEVYTKIHVINTKVNLNISTDIQRICLI